MTEKEAQSLTMTWRRLSGCRSNRYLGRTAYVSTWKALARFRKGLSIPEMFARSGWRRIHTGQWQGCGVRLRGCIPFGGRLLWKVINPKRKSQKSDAPLAMALDFLTSNSRSSPGAKSILRRVRNALVRGAWPLANETVLFQPPRIFPEYFFALSLSAETARPFFVPDFGTLLFCA